MHIGIIGAIPEEIEKLKEDMIISDIETISNREFISGKLNGLDVVVVFSRWGKVASAITTTLLINKFNVDIVVFTGVAGALSSELNIGDIVIANELYFHDLDPRPIFKKYQIPLTDQILLKSDSKLNELALIAANKFFSNLNIYIENDTLSLFNIEEPKAIIGQIATGDQFISSNEKRLEMRVDMPNAVAVEMEGASVAQVCLENNVPFIVIRIISDKADKSAEMDFTTFINVISKPYIHIFIQNFLVLLKSDYRLKKS